MLTGAWDPSFLLLALTDLFQAHGVMSGSVAGR